MSSTPPDRQVASRLVFRLDTDAELFLQIAVADTAGEGVAERLVVVVDGQSDGVSVTEVSSDQRGRSHLVTAGPGTLEIDYSATLRHLADPPVAPVEGLSAGFDLEAVVALRQSRYCQSDEMIGYASAELRHLERGPLLAGEIASWVFERLAYLPGSSGPYDTAADTLLAGAGVCRDFAHLTIAMCRAVGVPARLVAVYAPGLSPMDFHAVVEARQAWGWEVVDPTRLAPRSSLVRIATGRDAADTAFATTLRGEVTLLATEIFAVVDGDLPADDHRSPIALG